MQRKLVFATVALIAMLVGTAVTVGNEPLPFLGMLNDLFDDWQHGDDPYSSTSGQTVKMLKVPTQEMLAGGAALVAMAADGTDHLPVPETEMTALMSNYHTGVGRAVVVHPNGDLLVREGTWGYFLDEDGDPVTNVWGEPYPQPSEDFWLDPYTDNRPGQPTRGYYGEALDPHGHRAGVWFVFYPISEGASNGSWVGQMQCQDHPDDCGTSVAVSKYNEYRIR